MEKKGGFPIQLMSTRDLNKAEATAIAIVLSEALAVVDEALRNTLGLSVAEVAIGVCEVDGAKAEGPTTGKGFTGAAPANLN